MKFVRFNYALYSLLVTIIVAFSAQIAVSLADPEYQEVVNQLAPVFGVALGILLVGGYRYIPWIFLGALLPSLPYADNWMVALSVPIAVVVSASLGKVLVNVCRVPSDLATIRSSLILLLIGGLLTPLVGALMQTLLLFLGEFELVWGRFQNLLLSNWLAGGVGAMMCFPFILAWSNRETMTLGLRQMLEVLLWLTVLIVFGWITFENWAPTDVLLYPMELAIFPIMAWGGIRLGLRGATAGVLVLALVAAWELVPVLGADARYISQSPANVWIFVAIVSITSLCLASVMTELRAREAEIADNEGRLSAFTNALPDIAFVLSDRGRIEDAFASSPEIEANHRIVNADTVRGKRLDEVFDDVTARRFESVVRDVENCLFTEEVGFTLFLESGFDHAGTCATNTSCPCERDAVCCIRGAFEDRNQRWNALALNKLATNHMARALWSNHDDVNTFRSLDQLEVDREAVGEGECLAFGKVRSDVVFVDLRLLHVRYSDHDDVRLLNSFSSFEDFETLALGDVPGLATVVEANDYILAAVLQVLGVCVTLGTVADDGEGLPFEYAHVDVGFGIDFCRHVSVFHSGPSPILIIM